MNETDSILLEDLKAGWQKANTICRIDKLELKRGSINVLCGPNGAGKSTLLKTIAGQIAPLGGKIFIGKSELKNKSVKEIAMELAFVPQFFECKRCLSVEEWVAMGRNPHQSWWSWTKSEKDREKIEEALKRTDCEKLRQSLVDALSGGERQRVLIAAALAQEPSYLLLDEPTAHLDFRHQLELLVLLKQLKEEGLGILLVLHDLNLTARIADQVVLLSKKNRNEPSTVQAAGAVQEVFTREILREVYSVEMELLCREDGSTGAYMASSIC